MVCYALTTAENFGKVEMFYLKITEINLINTRGYWKLPGFGVLQNTLLKGAQFSECFYMS